MRDITTASGRERACQPERVCSQRRRECREQRGTRRLGLLRRHVTTAADAAAGGTTGRRITSAPVQSAQAATVGMAHTAATAQAAWPPTAARRFAPESSWCRAMRLAWSQHCEPSECQTPERSGGLTAPVRSAAAPPADMPRGPLARPGPHCPGSYSSPSRSSPAVNGSIGHIAHI
jgi:hypothetical protein